jgi:hypothetical protein
LLRPNYSWLSKLLNAIPLTPCLRFPVDAGITLVDAPYMEHSVPNGTGAVTPSFTKEQTNGVLNTVAQAECLLAVDAALTMVDVPVLREDSVQNGTGAVRPTYTNQPPKQLITPVRAPIKPQYIATNNFKVRSAKNFVYNYRVLVVFSFFT